jgi:hypothetical protein
MGMEKGRRKVQMFAEEQVEGLRSYQAQKHNRAGHYGEKLVGGRGSSRVGEGWFAGILQEHNLTDSS